MVICHLCGANHTSATDSKIYRQCCCHRCCWYWFCTLTCEYIYKFSKKFEMTLMLFSGASGKMLYEKNLKEKISRHCLFNNILWLTGGGLVGEQLRAVRLWLRPSLRVGQEDRRDGPHARGRQVPYYYLKFVLLYCGQCLGSGYAGSAWFWASRIQIQ